MMYRKGTTVRNHLSQDQTTEEACQCSFKGRAHHAADYNAKGGTKKTTVYH
jgi:hypothetical protein